jgi:hypothetical protein
VHIKPPAKPTISLPASRHSRFYTKFNPVPLSPIKQDTIHVKRRPYCITFPPVTQPIHRPNMGVAEIILSQIACYRSLGQSYLTWSIVTVWFVYPVQYPTKVPADTKRQMNIMTCWVWISSMIGGAVGKAVRSNSLVAIFSASSTVEAFTRFGPSELSGTLLVYVYSIWSSFCRLWVTY